MKKFWAIPRAQLEQKFSRLSKFIQTFLVQSLYLIIFRGFLFYLTHTYESSKNKKWPKPLDEPVFCLENDNLAKNLF